MMKIAKKAKEKIAFFFLNFNENWWKFLDWFFNPTAALIASILAVICAVISMALSIMGY